MRRKLWWRAASARKLNKWALDGKAGQLALGIFDEKAEGGGGLHLSPDINDACGSSGRKLLKNHAKY